MQTGTVESRQSTVDLVVGLIASAIRARNLAAEERLPGEYEVAEQLKSAASCWERLSIGCRAWVSLKSSVAAGPLVGCATADDIRGVRCLVKRPDNKDLPYCRALELDFAFHRKLTESAGNPLMRNMMEVIYEFVLTQMARTTPSQRDNVAGRKLHKAILRSVRNHDPDAAANTMEQHMQAVLDRLARAPS